MTTEYVPPQVFGDFRLERLLGSGGMGQVYLARHIKLDRLVALKFVRVADEEEKKRLEREAVVLARFSHPNVARLYYLSEVEGQPFLVMEYVEGRSLRGLRLPASEVLDLARQLTRGLAAIHNQNVLHRDIKPSNILLTSDNAPKILDFGVAKLLDRVMPTAAGAVPQPPRTDFTADADPEATVSRRGASVVAAQQPSGKTAQGAPVATEHSTASDVVGTLEYMAPEILRREAASEHSDIYSLGVVLYQLLLGHPPHRAQPVATLAERVQTTAAPSLRGNNLADVPRELAAIIDRCLRRERTERWASAHELGMELDRVEQRIQQRKRLQRAAFIGTPVLIVLLVVGHITLGWWEARRTAERAIREAERALSRARQHRTERQGLRHRAFAAFDAQQEDDGERVWASALAATSSSVEEYQRATRTLEEARLRAASHSEVRRLLADILYEQAVLYDEDHSEAQKAELWNRLNSLPSIDTEAYSKRWNAAAHVSLTTTPTVTSVEVSRYVADARQRYALEAPKWFWTTPIVDAQLPPGSYLLTFKAPGRATISLPLALSRDQKVPLNVHLPLPSEIPAGFAYAPAGRFQTGTAVDERVRQLFMNAAPLHEAITGSFLIARHETTFYEWVAFLKALPPEARKKRLPESFGTASQGPFELHEINGIWQITLRPTLGQSYTAREGEPIVYRARDRRRSVDWLRMPAVGIDYEDSLAYLTWLADTGKVPGARFCTELEWERGARGADGRTYPHGETLEPDDANYDATYARDPQSMGPDEVGSHPRSRSPFGLDDMAGNVWEWTLTRVIRSGAYYYDPVTLQSANRKPVEPRLRNHQLGLRVCASYPPPQ